MRDGIERREALKHLLAFVLPSSVPPEYVAAEDIFAGDICIISPKRRIYREGPPIRLMPPERRIQQYT